jgi:hypothetical protein
MKNGYPEKKELKYIRDYDIVKNPIRPLVEFIENIWWASDWGFKLSKHKDEYASISAIGDKPSRKYHYVLELHTGGWSGNEDIIDAMEQNKWFYNFYWHSSRTGGHYEYRIPEHSYDKKELK